MKFSELYRFLEENGWVKVTAIIEKASDGGYGIYCPDLEGGV